MDVMNILSWCLFGLLAGILAKWLMPGKDPGGMLITILIGIAGAFVGGFIATFLKLGDVTGFNFVSFAIAVGGACLLLFIWRQIQSRR